MLIFMFVFSVQLSAQPKDLRLYEAAYKYLNDSVVKVHYADAK